MIFWKTTIKKKIKVDERDSKNLTMFSNDSLDDEDDNGGKMKEDELHKFFNECERQVC